MRENHRKNKRFAKWNDPARRWTVSCKKLDRHRLDTLPLPLRPLCTSCPTLRIFSIHLAIACWALHAGDKDLRLADPGRVPAGDQPEDTSKNSSLRNSISGYPTGSSDGDQWSALRQRYDLKSYRCLTFACFVFNRFRFLCI